MKRCLSFLAVLLLAAGGSPAHDMVQPDWRGGGEGITFQQWTFSDASNPAQPDVSVNPYGQAEAAINVGLMGEGWLESLGFDSQTGMWDIGGPDGSITLAIDNRPLELPYKEIWLQVTYYELMGNLPSIDVPGAQFISGQTITIEEDPILAGTGWFLDQSVWRIEPNPSSEQIILTGADMGSTIDQIVVDTICIPEPCTAILLLTGTWIGLRKRLK